MCTQLITELLLLLLEHPCAGDQGALMVPVGVTSEESEGLQREAAALHPQLISPNPPPTFPNKTQNGNSSSCQGISTPNQ